ncbi:angiogenic factor with G patch and FHA domains 1 isoform X2 [Anoplophora glabripennis]|uniref:angiogenic factor with G patch and FHA domains 1 isoform X2 n=1 Tax=Anoplophora glabripennis TaxID=217634 RepID=UPI0008757E14|nr:angiogenic factor with G patch and FHA domains 1 isoform X2 [Anoplophora glabripennis]
MAKENENGTKLSENSCEESASKGTELIDNVNYELTPTLKEKLKDIPEAMEYIEKLHNIIKRQVKKIYKWKTRIKRIQKRKDICTQTDDAPSFNNRETNVDAKEEIKTLADDIKEAAEIAVQNSGFVYEETSGLYYDYNTGYYYNAEYGLYYDGTTGTYLKYNQETQSYEYHSQVQISQSSIRREKENEDVVGKRKSKSGHKTKVKNSSDMEGLMHSFNKMHINNLRKLATDISRQWPPCMRVIVESSDVSKVKVGSLHIITCDGGSLGREGNHSIIIPDINTSKHHLKFTFDKGNGNYFVTDVGSRNGTLLNNKRMSPSKQESDPIHVKHGSKIQIGSTVLLCHIHDGNHTCGHCEPGLVQCTKVTSDKRIYKATRAERHKKELKLLRKKCGIVSYDEDPKLASGYTDRAQQRRETVGSQNPHEKTQVASLDESISTENKGFKLLSKMGWKEGQSLGKDNKGMLEPIPLVSNKGTAGIGCTEDVCIEAMPPTEKQNVWKKTQERFQMLPETNEIFEGDSDE